MTTSTFNNRAKKVGLNKQSIAYRELFALLNGDIKESRPDISSRHRVAVYTADMVLFAERMGISIYKSNDAPKGGIGGNYVILTKKGKAQRFPKTK